RFALPIDDLVERYVIGRLSRPDAVELLTDHEAPDLAKLREQALTLRGRIDSLAAEFANDDDASPREFREASQRLRGRLAEVEEKMSHPQRSRVLIDLVLAEDPQAVWEAMALDRQRAV